jgi:plastocyanin
MLRKFGACTAALWCLGASAPGPVVTIDNFAFTPLEMAVARGTTVTWVNHDDIPHTVTSTDHDNAFRSPPLDTDDRFAFSFSRPGRYAYFCSLHAHMQGAIIVQ